MQSKAQIIATIGPATKDKEILKSMMEHQMDVVRLNFSWGTYEEHAEYIKNVREVAMELGKEIPIIQDLSGPREQKGSEHGFDESKESVITEKDLKDLEFGISHNVDYIAMSFVGGAEDVLKLKEEIKKRGALIPVISKIERKIALDNLDKIIEVTDAIMVARGDLGNAIPLEQIPFVEKDIILKCKKAGKPVITATQMMFSMKDNRVPTRAEMTDVAYAIMSGSDAVMLSEETAVGLYPVEVIEMMEKEIEESEKHLKDFVINPLVIKK
ncbi:MAG: pyruvate kinase [Candidatus Paceibacterota bacterium]|jgi:pyruvate kinase